jgi:hypothetical protein
MAAVLVNGISYGWGSIVFPVGGVPIVGVTKINYKAMQAKDNVYGAGYDPVSRGYGNKTYEGSITIKREELNRLILAAPGKDITNIAPFDIPVIYADGTRVDPRTDLLKAVEFKGFDLTANQGDTSIDVQLDLVIGKVIPK